MPYSKLPDASALQESFDCQRCGHCCEGRGGIVLQDSDLQRLALHFNMDESAFCASYVEICNGKRTLRVGEDELCVFYRQGCTVHEFKPAVCRAWPFFRGNLIDPISWEMASEDCPGIVLAAGHEAFVREGMAWLKAAGLFVEDSPLSPNALLPNKE
jgi:Fe-S-cluster containining protein